MDDVQLENMKSSLAYHIRNHQSSVIGVQLIHSSLNTLFKQSIFNKAITETLMQGLLVDSKTITSIVINGCGGTGGWFLPKLVKILNDAKAKGKLADVLDIYLIDGDKVSRKNLIRQNFIERDIDKNKAEVMCNRYSGLLSRGINMCYIDKYVTSKSILETYNPLIAGKFVDVQSLPYMGTNRGANRNTVLILNFVDNAVSRKVIHQSAINIGNTGGMTDAVVIDAGNNSYNGQVIVSSYPHVLPSNYYINSPDELYDNEAVKLENCADADLAANNPEQLFNANDFSAAVTGNLINTLFAENRIHYGQTGFTTGSNLTITQIYPLMSCISHGKNLLYALATVNKMRVNEPIIEQFKTVDNAKYLQLVQQYIFSGSNYYIGSNLTVGTNLFLTNIRKYINDVYIPNATTQHSSSSYISSAEMLQVSLKLYVHSLEQAKLAQKAKPTNEGQQIALAA